MPTYPDVPTRTRRIKRDNQPKPEVSEGGIIRAQDLSAQAVYDIELEHPYITASQVSTLQTFYSNNKNATITTRQLADGNTYDCEHIYEPEVEDHNATYKTVRQKLIGTRN